MYITHFILYYYLYQFFLIARLWKFLYFLHIVQTRTCIYLWVVISAISKNWDIFSFTNINCLYLFQYKNHFLSTTSTFTKVSFEKIFNFLLKYNWFTVLISAGQQWPSDIYIYIYIYIHIYIYIFFFSYYLPSYSIQRNWI